MNLELDEEHTSLLDALGKLLTQAASADRTLDGKRSFFSSELDEALDEAGFLEAATMEGFGTVAAAMVVQEIAAKSAIVEAAASSLVRPRICPDWPRPLAIIVGSPDRPARFLGEARAVIILDEREARVLRLDRQDTVPLDPFFAYPMARLADPAACLSRSEPLEDAELVRRLLLVAIACELSGVLRGALFSVTEHVTMRRQFGRPIGSFQAVQHRLAMCASTIEAGRWLARRAAGVGDMESALIAVGYLQDNTPRIVYDLHQFMGAMGLTLEHPLYRWTYRARLLVSDLGGASRQLRDAASVVWPE